MGVLKWIGCVIAALLLLAIVIGVYAFIHIIIAVVSIAVVIGLTASGIRAYFKGRPRKM